VEQTETAALLDPFFVERLARVTEDGDSAKSRQAFVAPADDWTMPDGVRVTDTTTRGPNGEVPLRIYEPIERGTDVPGLVWMHGGGFVSGDLDWGEAHAVAAELVIRAGAVVVSVDYRLAVGGVYHPVPVNDVLAAWRWASEHLDLDRLFIGGASAGANLAASASWRMLSEGCELPAGMILAYGLYHFPLPAADPSLSRALSQLPTWLRMGEGREVKNFTEYIGSVNGVPGDAAPGNYDLRGMPPALVDIDEFDDLRPSSELFALQLRDAGVPVRTHLSRGVVHGHLNWFPGATVAQVDESIDLFAQALMKGIIDDEI